MKNMSEMEVINFESTPSLVNRYMMELRDVTVQNDPMRFRTNLDRIGQIMAYEISKRLDYKETQVQTPLGKSVCREPADKVVLATILRAGIPFHHGFLSYFDHAENAFVSAYRRYREKGDTFDVLVEYLASPSLEERLLFWWTLCSPRAARWNWPTRRFSPKERRHGSMWPRWWRPSREWNT